jgi:hypothetical protein
MIIVNKVTFVNSSVYILLAYSSRGCIMYKKVQIVHKVYQTFQTNMDCAQEMLKARKKRKKLIMRTISFHLYPVMRKTSWQGEIFKSKMKNKKTPLC